MTDGADRAEARTAGTEIHDSTFIGSTSIHTGPGPQINLSFAAPERRRAVLAGLPPEPAGFVGRSAQVAELLEVLHPGSGDGAVLVCAVDGLAGVGKSALAIHTARNAVARGWFHGGVWLNLRGFDPHTAPLEPGEAVPELLRALGWDDDLPATAREQFALFHTVLAELAGRGERVLVVFDNVADAIQIEELLPRQETHRVVVTSRAALSSLGAHLLDLDVLGAMEAVALVARALRDARPNDPRASDEQALAVLAEACGRLPLALQIAAALLKASPHRTVASLAGQLADERARLETLSRFPDSALRPGVRAALHLSYERLDEPGQRLLRLLAIDPGPDTATNTVAALADLPSRQAQERLYALEQARLITSDEHERWSMHDLVRLYARELLETDPTEHARARDRLLDYYLTTAHAADAHLRALPGQPVPEAFAGRSQALEWFDSNRANLSAAVRLAANSGRLEIAVNLLAPQQVWRLEEAIDIHQQAAAIYREVGDRHREGQALDDLGIDLQQLRRFEDAIDAHQQAAAIFREVGDRHREGRALNNLSAARNASQLES